VTAVFTFELVPSINPEWCHPYGKTCAPIAPDHPSPTASISTAPGVDDVKIPLVDPIDPGGWRWSIVPVVGFAWGGRLAVRGGLIVDRPSQRDRLAMRS
jgi:hypothetical protein